MAIQQQLMGHDKDLGGGFMIRRLLPAVRAAQCRPVHLFRSLRTGDGAAGREP